MDETAIQAELAARTDPSQPQPPGWPAPPIPVKEDEAFHNSLPLEDLVTRNELMDYFDIPSAARHAVETTTWIGKIMDWARDEGGSSAVTDMMRVIHAQETTMGSQFKEQRVYKLYQYIKIHEQRKQLAERERALYA